MIKTMLMSAGDTSEITNMIKNINTVVSAALGILTAIVVGIAIYIAIKFFTADDDGKRKNAKQQLIYAIIGIIVLIALLIIAPQITDAVKNTVNSYNNTMFTIVR